MLRERMPNGVTVSDWLGTAMTAARLSAMTIERVRDPETRPPAHPDADASDPAVREWQAEMLRAALAHAEQAADELRTVLAHVAPEVSA